MTLESPVNQKLLNTKLVNKTWNFKNRQQNMELLSVENDLYIPRGSTRLSVLASCKPAFANVLPVPLVRGEFHFEDLAQENNRVQNSTANHANDDLSNPKFHIANKVGIKKPSGVQIPNLQA